MTHLRKTTSKRNVATDKYEMIINSDCLPNLDNHFSQKDLNAILESFNEFTSGRKEAISLNELKNLILELVLGFTLNQFLNFTRTHVNIIAFVLSDTIDVYV